MNATLEELCDLIDEYLADEIEAERFARLGAWLSGDSNARAFFVRYAQMHSQLHVDSHASRATDLALFRLREAAGEAGPGGGSSLAPRSPSSPVLGFLRNLDRFRRSFGSALWSTLAIASCVVLILTLVAVVIIRSNRVSADPTVAEDRQNSARKTIEAHSNVVNPAQVTLDSMMPAPTSIAVARLARAANCVWSEDDETPQLGDELSAGRELELKAGLAEIIFQSGAKAILEGPAVFEIRSEKTAILSRGKCTVTVEDPRARGFAIEAAGMRYIDLGTEFGVLVADDGEQEVHVFRGRVNVESAGGEEQWPESSAQSQPPEPSRQASRSKPFTLSAHEAIRIAPPNSSGKHDKPFEAIAADEKLFTRTMPDVQSFAIVSTGLGLSVGKSDAHWKIVRVSTEPTFHPQAAVVCRPQFNYAATEHKAQWISKAVKRENASRGCLWTFRTQFDLSGFDTRTARIDGRLSADDYLAEVRLNGKPLPLPAGARDTMLYTKWLPLTIDRGFVDGDNTLEIVVENRSGAMALCGIWQGTARRVLANPADRLKKD